MAHEPCPSDDAPGPPVEPEAHPTSCVHLRGYAEPLCAGCRVYRRHLNCWEVDASPCCQLDRHHCHTCDIFIGFLRSQTVAHRLEAHLSTGAVIRGVVHVTAGERLSDYLNCVQRRLLPLTEARVEVVGSQPRELDVIFVALDSLVLVVPEGRAPLGPQLSPAREPSRDEAHLGPRALGELPEPPAERS